jgi:hypothetical protein
VGRLITSPNLVHHDDVYERLLALHGGLDEADSRALNARLILLLINHIGDEQVIYEAFDAAVAVDHISGE